MGNYRKERVFIMLERPIPGIDHLKAVDPFALARVGGTAADTAGLGEQLEDFHVARYDGPEPLHDKPRWRRAAKGLKVVRALIALYEGWIFEGAGSGKGSVEHLQEHVAVLRQLETILDQADTREIRFYLAVKDLE